MITDESCSKLPSKRAVSIFSAASNSHTVSGTVLLKTSIGLKNHPQSLLKHTSWTLTPHGAGGSAFLTNFLVMLIWPRNTILVALQ